MKHSRLRAQVAPYLEAIIEERSRGGTWGEIGVALGMSAKQVRLASKFCRYKVPQIPLPEPEPATPPAQPAAAPKAAQPGTNPAPARQGFKKIELPN